MRAILLDGPVEPEGLRVRRVAVPEPAAGWVRIKVEAFGLNRSEYHLRAGLATNARFPVIPGIGSYSPMTRRDGVAAFNTVLAKEHGLTVFSTTRNPQRVDVLRELGVDHPIVDDGNVAGKVREILPGGVHAALELVGTNVLPDTLRATAVHGTVCFTGMLSDSWTIPDFYPIGYLPNGVRLTAYGGESSDLPADAFQRYVDLVAAGKLPIRIDRVFTMDEIGEAHRIMQDGKAVGKLVVRVS